MKRVVVTKGEVAKAWGEIERMDVGFFAFVVNDMFVEDLDPKGASGEIKINLHKHDNVNHPAHYNTGKIEVIEFIEDKNLGFNLGNTVKYVSRAGKKDRDKELEDLEKAAWYLRREIELLKASLKGEHPCRPNDMKRPDPLPVSGPGTPRHP